MNNLDKIYEEVGLDKVAFSKGYTEYLIKLLAKLDNFTMKCNFQFTETNQEVNDKFSNEMESVLVMNTTKEFQSIFMKQDESKEIALSFYVDIKLEPIF